ncbi:MAG: tripartite tricarboxylate transporter TctB family protein [Gemmatimonadota bacterium]
MHPRLRSIIPHTVMLVVSALLYYAATLISVPGGEAATRIGPDAWPKFIIGAMAALCVYEIVTRLLVGTSFTATGLTQGLNRPPDEADRELADIEPEHHNGMLFAGIGLIAAYVLGVAYAGFFVGTAAFLALFSWIGGVRRPLLVTTIGLIGGFVLLVIFMRVAYVSLPIGVGPFKAVSVLLLRLVGV